jgi:AraC-like DNA-binding protein
VTEVRLGALHVATHGGTPPYVLGGTGPEKGTGAASVAVGIHTAGRALVTQPGLREVCVPGEVFVLDLSRPWELSELDDAFRLHLFVLPQDMIGLAEGDLRFLHGLHGRSDGHVPRLLVSLLEVVARSATTSPAHVARGVAGSVADLLHTMAVERKAAGRAVHGRERDERAALARRVRHFVNENIADRTLSPERIAAHHRVSVRYLHKVFADEGITLSRWIRRRRLEECRRELARPAGDAPAVSFAAIARRWGFANAAHFSRSFRVEYGMTPGEWHRIRTAADR